MQGPNSPYTLGSGILTTDNTYVGQSGTGIFNQTGGTHTVNPGGQLFLGANGGASGTYNLSGGTLTTSTDVGDSGTGVFTLSGFGIHNVTGVGGGANGSLDIGYYSGSNGTYNLNGGTLIAGYVRGNLGTSTFNFNGGTLAAGAGATDFLQGLTFANVGDGGAVIDTSGFNVTVAQALRHAPALGTSADGGLRKNGAGTLTLTGASTYRGGTTVNAGTLAVVSGGGFAGGTVFVNAGGTLAISGTGSVNRSSGGTLIVDGTAASPAALTLSDSASLSTGAANIGNGSVTQSGGAFTTNGNDFSLGSNAGSNGAYTLTGGSLSTGDATVGTSGSGTFTQSGGGFSTNGNDLYLGYYAGSNGTYLLSGTGSLTTGNTYVSDDANTGVFTQNGGTHTTGTLYLGAGSDLANGTYHLDGGTLAANNVTRQTGTGVFNFNGGTLQARQNNTAFFQNLSTANVRGGGAVIDTAGFNVAVAQNLTHSNLASDAALDGGLTKNGAGTLTLTGNNTYTGSTVVNAGTLFLDAGGNATRLLRANAGTEIDYNHGTIVGGNLSGPGTQRVLGGGASFASPTAGVLTIFNGVNLAVGGPTTFNQVNSSGAITVAANQTLAWNDGQNDNGTLTLNGQANTSGWISTGVITVNNGGKLANSASNLVLGGGSRTTINAGGTLSTASGTTIELNGALLTNNGAQTGTLNVNYGSTAKGTGSFGTVNVTDGAGLGGTGSAAGGVLVSSGGTLLGGDGTTATGALTLGDALTLTSGATLQLALGSGGAHSSLARTGSGAWSFPSHLSFAVLDFGAQPGRYDNLITGLSADPGTENTWVFTDSRFQGSFTFDGANIDLNVVAVPESATWLGGALVVATWCWRRRRQFVRPQVPSA